MDEIHKEMWRRQPFPLLDQLPDILDGVVLDYLWDLDKLHALTDLREVMVPIQTLAWHLDLPFWAECGKPFMVCPLEVAADHDKHFVQWERTMAADLQFPLHARIDRTGKLIIMDGIHRLLKATILDLPFVHVRILTEDDLNKIAKLIPQPPKGTAERHQY